MKRRLATFAVAFVAATLLPLTSASAATNAIPLHMTGTSTKTVPVGVAALVPLDPVSQLALNIACLFTECPNGLWSVGVDIDDVDMHIQFTQDVNVGTSYTDGLLSEGKVLDVVDTVNPSFGTAKVTADISGEAGAYVDGNAYDIDPFTKNLTIADVSCAVPAPGEPDVACDLPPADLTIVSLPMFPGIGVDLAYRLDASINVSSNGMATMREYKVVAASDTDPLAFASPTLADPYSVPCGAAGNDLSLNLSSSALTVDPSIPANLQLVVKFTIGGQQVGDAAILADKPLGALDFPVAELTDAGVDGADLGTIAADGEAPTVSGVASSYSGAEGSEIGFSATVTDGCGADDVVWRFSDGGTEYGTNVHRAFPDNGSYTGNVTATDARGNKTVKNFTVQVSNQAPAANAGLATIADWGRPVAFSGQATDPGSADLASLAYTWDFGDGSPSATGTKDAIHTYGAPGVYTATLTVTDKDGASSQATRSVTITKRNATLVYTGAKSALPNKYAALSATLSDEYGEPVVGRKVTFTVGTQTVDGWTSSSGAATVSLKLTQKTGTYSLSATFAEDSHYFGSTTPPQSFKVGK
jgi:hypothetical protein